MISEFGTSHGKHVGRDSGLTYRSSDHGIPALPALLHSKDTLFVDLNRRYSGWRQAGDEPSARPPSPQGKENDSAEELAVGEGKKSVFQYSLDIRCLTSG